MMIKAKLGRFFKRIKARTKSLLLLWLPAIIVVSFFAFLLLSVSLDKNNSFKACSTMFVQCANKEDITVLKTAKCATKVALCDVQVVWLKAQGKSMPAPDLPGLPVVNEQEQKELFEKITTQEFLDNRFKENSLAEKEALKTEVVDKDTLKEYMEQAKQERLNFEKEQNLKRLKQIQELDKKSFDDKLTSQIKK